MLLGLWKNIQDLEDSLNLEELELIVKAARDKEHREQAFLAALKGIDIDADNENTETPEERLERIKRRAEAKAAGMTEEEIDRKAEYEELSGFGIEVETEE